MYNPALLLLALASQALSKTIQCRDYIPESWAGPSGRIPVTNYGQPNPPPTLPANTSAYNPWQVASQTSPGATFHFKTCNATRLGLTGPSFLDTSCSEVPPGTSCYVDIQDYIQVIGPNGHCLTQKFFNASVTELVFRDCDYNARNASQLFSAVQDIYCHSSNASVPGGCGDPDPPSVFLYPRGISTTQREYWTFQLAQDNVTLLVVEKDSQETFITPRLEQV